MSTAVSQHPSEIGPIVVMGVSASGKSLIGRGLAKKLGVPFIEGDDLHSEANVEKMHNGVPLTDEDRWPWLSRIASELAEAAKKNGGAIVSCSALKKAYRDHLRKEVGEDLRFVFLKGDKDVLRKRIEGRHGHFMPSSLLDSQFETLEVPTDEPGVVTVDVDALPDAIVAEALRALDAGAG